MSVHKLHLAWLTAAGALLINSPVSAQAPPPEAPFAIERGLASWYGPGFQSRPTANGERYDMGLYTAAHRTLPLPSYVHVRNLRNGRQVVVVVNDRGPFVDGRMLDLSYAAARQLGMVTPGVVEVEIIPLTPAQVAQWVEQNEPPSALLPARRDETRDPRPEAAHLGGLAALAAERTAAPQPANTDLVLGTGTRLGAHVGGLAGFWQAPPVAIAVSQATDARAAAEVPTPEERPPEDQPIEVPVQLLVALMSADATAPSRADAAPTQVADSTAEAPSGPPQLIQAFAPTAPFDAPADTVPALAESPSEHTRVATAPWVLPRPARPSTNGPALPPFAAGLQGFFGEPAAEAHASTALPEPASQVIAALQPVRWRPVVTVTRPDIVKRTPVRAKIAADGEAGTPPAPTSVKSLKHAVPHMPARALARMPRQSFTPSGSLDTRAPQPRAAPIAPAGPVAQATASAAPDRSWIDHIRAIGERGWRRLVGALDMGSKHDEASNARR